MYIMRLTITRATLRLIPTLILLWCVLFSFAVYGNQSFSLTTSAWQSLDASLAATIYLLRAPVRMDFHNMENANALWPYNVDDISPFTIAYIAGFTFLNVFVMTSLYRVVVMNEYSKVLQMYSHRHAGDLTNEPWPSFDPFYYTTSFLDKRKQATSNNVMCRRQVKEWHVLLAVQKRKQKELLERFRQQQSPASSAAPKKQSRPKKEHPPKKKQ